MLSSDPLSAGGVTVITHGLNSGVGSWILPMAARFDQYPRFPGTAASCYQIDVTESGGQFNAAASWVAGPTPDVSDSGEIIIKLDWSDLDGLFGGASSTQVAGAAAEALLDSGLIAATGGRPLAELPLHLMGHSRGASVATEIARKLGEKGVWVDHVTTWDPVPFGSDGAIRIWENVLYADNYWQEIGGFFVPIGMPLDEAYNRKLTSLNGGYSTPHSDVHLWYHGTIDFRADAGHAEATIPWAERTNWWTAAETADVPGTGMVPGAVAGFYYSLIGGGDRTSAADPVGAGQDFINDGYNRHWDFGLGMASNREPIVGKTGQWPNVIVCRRTTTGPVAAGTSFELALHYQSEASATEDTTLTVLLDPDRNPWNGNEASLGQQVITGSGSMDPLATTLTVPVAEGNAGVFAILTRIEQGGRTRYLYVPEALEIAAALPPPFIAPGSLHFASGLFSFTVQGTSGQSVVIQACTDLVDWQPIAAQVLVGTTWEFSDPDTGMFAERFYRVGAE